MRQMYDSVTAKDIPLTAQMVAGYIDGPYAWSGADWDLFPDATRVRITVTAAVNDGDVLDVEAGDATPQQAPQWVQARRRFGHQGPTIYCSTSAQGSIMGAFLSAGIALPLFWLAQYDGVPDRPASAIAKQYANAPFTGGHFDLSVVADYWPGVDDVIQPDLARGLVKQFYLSVLHREPESEDVVNANAADIMQNGYEQWISKMADTQPEAQHDINLDHERDAAAQ